ncbi:MAG: hypothetical protein AAFQ65_12115 [Myxococcota bacterium]
MITITESEVSAHVLAALENVKATDRSDLERAEALVEIALDLQKQPREPQELFDAIYLYERAVELSENVPLAQARAIAGRGSALRRLPGGGDEALAAARAAFEEALDVMRARGEAEEVAEVELSYGLVLQAQASTGRAKLPDAIAAYQRALRFFKRETHPREFAVLHNNLATAYLSMRMSGDKMREALAVQSFREALKVVTIEEDPTEYAMLQNNLGNALQAVESAHRFENLTRAVEAYDEALRVRTEYDTPIEYANTLANKANAVMNLPDDADQAELGSQQNISSAIQLLQEAGRVFEENRVIDRAAVVRELASELGRELEVAHG